jgi:hypothetical protein
MTKPLNEYLLWKGTIQRANYPKPIMKPDMILPKINGLTGKVMNQPNLHEMMNASYAVMSRAYWDRVKLNTARMRALRKTQN